MLFVLALFACGESTPPAPQPEPVAAPAPAPSPEAVPTVVSRELPYKGHLDTLKTVPVQTVDMPPGPGEAAIEKALSPEILAADIGAVAEETMGIRTTLTWTRAPVLEVLTEVDTMGAYPSTFTRIHHFDTRTGAAIDRDGFQDGDKLDALLEEKYAPIRAARKQALPADAVDFAPQFDAAKPGSGGYTLSDAGVTFRVVYEVPHVVEALFPPDEVLLDWPTVKPFLTGALAETAP